MKLVNNRKNFLSALPQVSETIPLIKIIGMLLLGIVLSFVSVVSFSRVIEAVPSNFQPFIGVAVQDIPVVALFTWLYYRHRKSMKAIFADLLPAKDKNTILITALSFVLMFGATFAALYVIMLATNDTLDYTSVSSYYESDLNFRFLLTSLTGLILYLLLAFFEEFVFRFVIYRNLRAKGFAFALVVSALIFAVLHMNMGLPFSFLGGVILAVHYEYTNNIVSTAVLHALHNYLSFFYASYLVIKLFT